MAIDLFGFAVPDRALTPKERRKLTGRSNRQPNGYAWKPGSGPQGETCKSCRHIVRVQSDGGHTFRKCALMEAHWTRGPGSDIKASAPACRHWEKPE